MGKLDINKLKKGGLLIEEKDFSSIDSKFLKDLRSKLKMSQALLADYLGVTKKAIEKWEQEKNKINGPVARMLYLINDNPDLLMKIRNIYQR